MHSVMNIHFAPLLPYPWIGCAGVIAFSLLLWSYFLQRDMPFFRVLCAGIFLMFLMGPSLIKEERELTKDVVFIIRDKSPSQSYGARTDLADKAEQYLKNKLSVFEDLDVRFVNTKDTQAVTRETLLFKELEQASADVPRSRRAGVILITDGQVHDVPKNIKDPDQYGPVHVLLTGDKNEKDRHLKIIEAPAYGITGQNVTVKFRIEDTNIDNSSDVEVTLKAAQGSPETFSAPVGQDQTIELPVTHAGQNVFELSAESENGELTQANNRAAILVNGVRDRLKVLLVSGQPYAGARTWRDLLTSDPAVDLVHFTILRDPDKIDSTPSNELSLIAFPIQELFETKLFDFDLIIFDRYRMNNVLPDQYFDNIARYVEKGGALLVTSGPSDATNQSIYFSSLMNILPGATSGNIIRKSFIPTLTKIGRMHPVTKNLEWSIDDKGKPNWGSWLRQISISSHSGETLMNGADERPLLILDRVGEGRVAQIASDHIWLWSRGYQGGGPYAELIRRVIHWLMKEPELDEKMMSIKVVGDNINLSSQDYTQKEMSVVMTKPDGTKETLVLPPSSENARLLSVKADQIGIYSFEEITGQKQFAIVGDINPPELGEIKTTADVIAPVVTASKGGTIWLSNTPEPMLRRTMKNQGQAGYNWIGLRQNNDYTVKGVTYTPLLPAWMAVMLLACLTLFMWWREGKR